jgi:Ca2+-binding RTX toxin-like protein
MRGLAFAVALGAALAGAATANAGTVTLSGDTLSYDAAPGQANRVFVVQDPNGKRLIDTGAAVTAGAGCTSVNANEAFCAAADPTILTIDVAADDMNDYVDLSSAGLYAYSALDGGTGDDTLIGGDTAQDNLYDGGPGADTFVGRGTVDYSARTNPVTVTVGDDLANDGEANEHDNVPSEITRVLGGEAGDTMTTLDEPNVEAVHLVGNDGDDHLTDLRHSFFGQLDGNLGKDELRVGNTQALVHGGDGNDLLVGGRDGQSLVGDRGDDVIRGSWGRDRLIGGSGADEIHGGPGKDDISADTGPDTIFARDGTRDIVDGGPSMDDRAQIDDGLDRVLNAEIFF